MLKMIYTSFDHSNNEVMIKSLDAVIQHHIVRSCAIANVTLADGSKKQIKHRSGCMSIAGV